MKLSRSVPARTARRSTRRRAASAGLAGLAVLALAGCAPDNTPKAYGAEVETSFVNFCTGGVTPVNGVTSTIATDPYCRCAYGVFKDNVPYNDEDRTNRFSGKYAEDKPTFFNLNNDLKDDPAKIDQLPDDVKTKLTACGKVQENVTPGSTPPGSAPSSSGTTAPASTSGSVPA